MGQQAVDQFTFNNRDEYGFSVRWHVRMIERDGATILISRLSLALL
jgi:hypothetical protein